MPVVLLVPLPAMNLTTGVGGGTRAMAVAAFRLPLAMTLRPAHRSNFFVVLCGSMGNGQSSGQRLAWGRCSCVPDRGVVVFSRMAFTCAARPTCGYLVVMEYPRD